MANAIKKINGVARNNIKKLSNKIGSLEFYLNSLYNDGNLVSYFRLEGNANDAKNVNNGTGSNITYSTANGRINQGAGFNGSTSKIVCADSASLRLTGAYSFSQWINIPTLPTNDVLSHQLYCKYDTGAPGGAGGYEGAIRKTGGVDYITCGNYGGASYQANITLPINVWLHVVITWDGTNFVVYVNNSVVSGTKTGTGSALTNSKPLNIGTFGQIQSTTELGRWFPGAMDEIIIFNKALSAAEVTSIYSNQIKKFIAVSNV